MQAVTSPPPKHRPRSHSFANEWLLNNCFTPPTLFYEVYQGDTKILNYDIHLLKKPLYNIVPGPFGRIVDTFMMVGVDLYKKKMINEVSDYNRLLDLGFAIASAKPKTPWFSGQKRMYIIIPKQMTNIQIMDRIPQDHKVFWDVYNRRLILQGQNAGPPPDYVGQWVEMERQRKVMVQKKRTVADYIKNPFKTEREHIQSIMPHSPEELPKIPIDEIAMMIDEKGQIICLPKSRDEPTIGIVGQKGKGKSLCLHRLADMAYWKGRRKIAILNDDRSECDTWCKPWDADPIHKKFGLGIARELAMLGERPLPLPAVYVHAMNNSLRHITHEHECGITMSFPFEDLVNNYEYYMEGHKGWELDNSLVYFKNIKDSILLCKNLQEIEQTINELIDKGLQSTKVKLIGMMRNMFTENMLDMSNGIPPKLRLKIREIDSRKTLSEIEYLPFITLMLADLVPILETASLKNKGYYPQYFRFVAGDIFKKQTEDPYFIKNKIRIWEFCDEIQNIDSNRHKTVASDVLIKTVTEGRPNRTGFVWASQNPEKLSTQITTNTQYLFVLGFANKDQASSISKNFNLLTGREKDILSLGKREAIACTTDQFVVYDRDGNRRLSNPNESFRGILLPPLSEHKPPAEEEL